MAELEHESETVENQPAIKLEKSTSHAAESVMQTGQSAAEQIGQVAKQQKQAGAEQMASMADAIHGAARQLEDPLPDAAKLVHNLASTMESGATTLRERSLGEIVADINRLAHDQPLGFFGGAVLAGFAISRFLKSSAQHTQSGMEV